MGENTDAEAVDRIVGEVLELDGGDFDDGSTFGTDVPAESLDYIEIAEQVEETCDVELTDEDLESIDTVGDLKRVVGNR